jgi:hypothetical protein
VVPLSAAAAALQVYGWLRTRCGRRIPVAASRSVARWRSGPSVSRTIWRAKPYLGFVLVGEDLWAPLLLAGSTGLIAI